MITIVPDFQTRGACRTPDPDYGYDLHFPVSEAAGNEPQIARAIAVCLSCPVLADCRAYALTHPGQTAEGIWGGMTEDERRAVRARELKRERELAATQASGQADGEQLPDEPERAAPALPSYQTARARLTKARRALTLAQKAGDADAISRAEQRVADAEQQFAAVRTQDTAGAVA